MARIAGVESEQAGLVLRLIYWVTRRKFGRMLEPLKVAAHQPRLVLFGLGGMENAQQAMRTIPQALKSLAQVEVARYVGCRF